MLVEIIGKRNEEKLVTTSLKVAETFTYFDEEEKKQYTREHKSILRSIRELKCSDKFRGEHFAPSEYIDGRGKNSRALKWTEMVLRFLLWVFLTQSPCISKKSTSKNSTQWKMS